MRRVKATNPNLMRLLYILRKAARKNKAEVWRTAAEYLSKPRRRRVAVNLSRINRYTRDGDVVMVPGKVLGSGLITHSVTVAAFAFSNQARQKIVGAKGKCLSIPELIELNPKGSNVKIIG
ncbi:MAG: 50S ribosomal protein L18e [Candidatus Bathyarchaeota archaeon]|nr:50S ribosomal protein L18e [Candidatus Bathyarchaeota archaeon]